LLFYQSFESLFSAYGTERKDVNGSHLLKIRMLRGIQYLVWKMGAKAKHIRLLLSDTPLIDHLVMREFVRGPTSYRSIHKRVRERESFSFSFKDGWVLFL